MGKTDVRGIPSNALGLFIALSEELCGAEVQIRVSHMKYKHLNPVLSQRDNKVGSGITLHAAKPGLILSILKDTSNLPGVVHDCRAQSNP